MPRVILLHKQIKAVGGVGFVCLMNTNPARNIHFQPSLMCLATQISCIKERTLSLSAEHRAVKKDDRHNRYTTTNLLQNYTFGGHCLIYEYSERLDDVRWSMVRVF